MNQSLFQPELIPSEPPSTCDLKEYDHLPSLRSLYLNVFLKRRAGLARDESIPLIGLGAPLLLESEWLTRYLKICEWQTDQALSTPLTVGQVCAAHAQSALLLGPHFPLSPLGLVHASNEILAHTTLPLNTPLWVWVWFGKTEWRPRGMCIDLHTVISTRTQRDQPLWIGKTQAFKAHAPDQAARKAQRAQVQQSSPALSTHKNALASVHFPLAPNMGRRYAPIAGDRNPIHLYPWSARLFGFKRPIMHGMWSLARSLAYANPNPEASSIGALQVTFKRPIDLPSTPSLTLCPYNQSEHLKHAQFELRTEADQLAIEGSWKLS